MIKWFTFHSLFLYLLTCEIPLCRVLCFHKPSPLNSCRPLNNDFASEETAHTHFPVQPEHHRGAKQTEDGCPDHESPHLLRGLLWSFWRPSWFDCGGRKADGKGKDVDSLTSFYSIWKSAWWFEHFTNGKEKSWWIYHIFGILFGIWNCKMICHTVCICVCMH